MADHDLAIATANWKAAHARPEAEVGLRLTRDASSAPRRSVCRTPLSVGFYACKSAPTAGLGWTVPGDRYAREHSPR
jgi:hypothetical protein